MKPRIDIDIHDYEGKPVELQDPNSFEPFEIYLNDERIFTSEKVEELESENASLRGAVEGFAEQNDKLREFATLAWQVLTRNEPLYVWQGMVDDARELGIEVKDD